MDNRFDDIKSYNLINLVGEGDNPNSENETKKIEVMINNIGNVIIKASISLDYYWLSITKADDTELNKVIIDYIENNDTIYRTNNRTNFHNVLDILDKNGISSEDLKGYMEIDTESATSIGTKAMLNNSRRLCVARDCSGEYKKILKKYIEKVESSPNNMYLYELDIKPIQKVLSMEDYLRVSDDKELTSLYIQCCEAYHSYYCSVMTFYR